MASLLGILAVLSDGVAALLADRHRAIVEFEAVAALNSAGLAVLDRVLGAVAKGDAGARTLASAAARVAKEHGPAVIIARLPIPHAGFAQLLIANDRGASGGIVEVFVRRAPIGRAFLTGQALIDAAGIAGQERRIWLVGGAASTRASRRTRRGIAAVLRSPRGRAARRSARIANRARSVRRAARSRSHSTRRGRLSGVVDAARKQGAKGQGIQNRDTHSHSSLHRRHECAQSVLPGKFAFFQKSDRRRSRLEPDRTQARLGGQEANETVKH